MVHGVDARSAFVGVYPRPIAGHLWRTSLSGSLSTQRGIGPSLPMKKFVKQRAYRDSLCLLVLVAAFGFLLWDASRVEESSGWIASPRYLVFWLGMILACVVAGGVVFFDAVQVVRRQRQKEERRPGTLPVPDDATQAVPRP